MYDRANVQHSGLGLEFEIPGIVQKKNLHFKMQIFFYILQQRTLVLHSTICKFLAHYMET